MKDQSTNRFWYGVGLTALAAVVSIAFGEIGLNVGYWPGPGYGDGLMMWIAYIVTFFAPSAIYVLNFVREKSFCHKNPGKLPKRYTLRLSIANMVILAVSYGLISTFSSSVLFSSNLSDFWWFYLTAGGLTTIATLVSLIFFGYIG